MNRGKQSTERLISFYRGEKPDLEGRKIQDIWAWDFEKLECTHDYIQWLFPIPEKSLFNPNAPVANEEIRQAFHGDRRLRQNLLKSLTVMLRFYGLECHENQAGKVTVQKSEEFPERKLEWICLLNHNYLRITRILKCLVLFGLQDEAQAFYDCLC